MVLSAMVVRTRMVMLRISKKKKGFKLVDSMGNDLGPSYKLTPDGGNWKSWKRDLEKSILGVNYEARCLVD